MSSLSAMTRSFSLAFMCALLLPPRGIGAANALGLDRGDQAGLERNLPGAADVGPPFLLLAALGLAHEVQRLVLPPHAGAGELDVVLLRFRHDQSIDHDVG